MVVMQRHFVLMDTEKWFAVMAARLKMRIRT